jgi:hypothetical protein
MFMRSDIHELCEFTQRLYLGLPSSHDMRQEKRRKRAATKQSREAANNLPPT